ncbi:uncharacterized protein LOC126376362 [Pectinophora gossypiella]|uniref:uncharacterized protein LOC126376362 n=1 Tax=Pectinophora gossypiella TaxID=13191 RepID=UPI00214EF37E|nr:uncharacterized protein LOC126376362 [Pectinophora gossypiella]XP_049879638.1 uncharacterized protein LOC126376362 [Pectinophora gossypiella]XP_049879639.1 uncharacterized protein LOC126376362 [Pectinophora gossypiella]XP_049879641.1 uncharacterized protein LOC126376362 [Pectinophora gossypiella]
MESRRGLSLVLVVALLGQAFSVPLDAQRLKRGYADNELDTPEGAADLEQAASNSRDTRDDVVDVAGRDEDEPSKVSLETTTTKSEFATPVFDDDSSEEDDDFEPMNTAPSTGGGSNIFSLLKLANALFPSSSGANQSKTPSSEPASPFWTLKMDILRALLQFGTSLLGSASSSSSAGSA